MTIFDSCFEEIWQKAGTAKSPRSGGEFYMKFKENSPLTPLQVLEMVARAAANACKPSYPAVFAFELETSP